MQLLSHFSEGRGGGSEVTCQFQSVGGVLFDVLHDVSVFHPLRHSDELPFLHIPSNSNELQDVRMGHRTP